MKRPHTHSCSPVLLLLMAGLLAPSACTRPDAPPSDFASLAEASLAGIEGRMSLPGLRDEVDIIRDRWGVPHIYASNVDDLFFAQGFVQAQDRLWQMEMWRRYAEGRFSEVLGAEALPHDRLVRTLSYRDADSDAEFESYHPEGRRIFEAFAAGVNAFIDHAGDDLPVEFRLTGVRPTYWDATTPALRIPTRARGAARSEIRLARQVASLGIEEANRRIPQDPPRALHVPEGFDLGMIGPEVDAALDGLRGRSPRVPLLPEFEAWITDSAPAEEGAVEADPGSNNWAISGELTASGLPIVQNDPHRQVTNPSIRYIVHLDAPGWTAAGATEPAFPGIAIGHNGRVAWGLTIVGTDMDDVFVERLNPENLSEVLRGESWVPLERYVDTIQVRDREPEVLEVLHSPAGPLFFVDSVNAIGYALRSVMHEPGGAEYLGALRLHQVDDCHAFIDQLRHYLAPSENMVCGDVEGNIAWQAAAASPARTGGWHGRLPVPAWTGGYRWDGFRDDLPTEINPERGWIATANHNIQPPDFDPPLFFKAGPPYRRYDRLEAAFTDPEGWWAGVAHRTDREVGAPRPGDQGPLPWTPDHSRVLVLDAWSAVAAEAIRILQGWEAADPELEEIRTEIAGWDAFFDRESRAAALYTHWRRALPGRALNPGTLPGEARELAESALAEGLASIREDLGDDAAEWRWGRMHRSTFPHPLVRAYDVAPRERSGGSGTVAATGATYREIFDLSNLDASMVTNTPGQSAQPGSPFYDNLAANWADGEFFPLLWSRDAVEREGLYRLTLVPAR